MFETKNIKLKELVQYISLFLIQVLLLFLVYYLGYSLIFEIIYTCIQFLILFIELIRKFKGAKVETILKFQAINQALSLIIFAILSDKQEDYLIYIALIYSDQQFKQWLNIAEQKFNKIQLQLYLLLLLIRNQIVYYHQQSMQIIFFVSLLLILLFVILDILLQSNNSDQPQTRKDLNVNTLINKDQNSIPKVNESYNENSNKNQENQVEILQNIDNPLQFIDNPLESNLTIKPQNVKNEVNEDELIIKKLPWIQNQQVLVYSSSFEIVYQTFFLGKYLRQEINLNENEYQNIFLESEIHVGNKEVIELFTQPRNEFSCGSSIIINGVDNRKFSLVQKQNIYQFMVKILSNSERWNSFMFIVHQFENPLLNFDKLKLRIFLQQIKKEPYFVIFFEQDFEKSQQTNLVSESQVLINVMNTFIVEIANYLNTVFTTVILQQFEEQNEQDKVYSNSLKKYSFLFEIFLNNMRDHVSTLQNQFFFKITQFKIHDLVDELYLIFDESFRAKESSFIPKIDLPESVVGIYTDYQRLKQIITTLISFCLKYTIGGQIRLDIKLFNAQSIVVQIKEQGLSKDDKLKFQLFTQVKNMNQMLRFRNTSFRELDLSQNLMIQIISVIAFQLSGSLKRGLEFSYDKNGTSTFSFYVESSSQESKQALITNKSDVGPIRLISQTKYFETSLSLLLAQAQDSSHVRSIYDEEKVLSLSQLSKQFSIKPGEPIDLQSAYFSQISKIRADSHLNQNSYKQSSHQQSSNPLQQDQILQKKQRQQKSQKSQSNSKGESYDSHRNNQSYLDFGDSHLTLLEPPIFTPKLLDSVIKFKLSNECCSKVLIIENDHFNSNILNLYLSKYGIKVDKAYTGLQGLEMIENKKEHPCRCQNKSYLLFFIEINLPFLNGLDVVQKIKQQMRDSQIDKGIAIAITAIIDLNSKLECFRNGIDYFLGKPFDLIELTAILKYIQV